MSATTVRSAATWFAGLFTSSLLAAATATFAHLL